MADELVAACISLGDLASKQDRYDEAEKFYREGLTAAAGSKRDKYSRLADCAGRVAACLHAQEKHSQVLSFGQQCLAEIEPKISKDGPDLLPLLEVLLRSAQVLEKPYETQVFLAKFTSLMNKNNPSGESLMPF